MDINENLKKADEVSFANEGKKFKQEIRDGLYYWTPNGVGSKDSYMSPSEKVMLLRRDEELRKKAQWRAETCCYSDCNNTPYEWVVEVKFDLKHVDASTDRTATIDTGKMKAEIPGLCHTHKDKLPSLVQQVFYMQIETWWGFKPTRWIARFIDGSSVVGNMEQIILPIKHEVTDTLIHEGAETN